MASSVGVTRPIVQALFVASCLLSIVSWYTTQQGMALYLSTWFSLLASLGMQSALVFVAWLIGFTKSKRGLLIAVYVITAAVSISFSYVSLYTWFSARERPMQVERKLYDKLNDTADHIGMEKPHRAPKTKQSRKLSDAFGIGLGLNARCRDISSFED